MAEQLRPEGLPVYLDDIVLTTPGLTGRVELHWPGTPGMRAAEDATPEFHATLREGGMTEQFTLEITDQAELDTHGGSRAAGGDADIVVQVPGPGDGYGQVLLYCAEDGSLSWHFPDDVTPAEVPSRGADRRTYRIPRAVTPTGQPGAQRGAISAIGKKLLKLLVFPLMDKVAGAVGEHFVARWEQHHRRDLIRTFYPDNYRTKEVGELAAADWQRLAAGPALLFVHGTMSQSHTGFRRLPPQLMRELHDRYQGRVFAFDHRTVSVTPTENAAWFARQVPPGLSLTIDAIAHSRGGLVGRVLAEHGTEFGAGGDLSVRTLVMVGTPNAGTVLADVAHLNHLLDRITGLVQFYPDNGVVDVLDIVLSIVKQFAVGACTGLDGLMSMNPSGTYLPALNSGPGCATVYRAIASDYEPIGGSPLTRIARDGILDIVFARQRNDLIVPTEGAFIVPGANGFPIAEPLVFEEKDGVDHSGYWDQQRFASTVLDWLPG